MGFSDLRGKKKSDVEAQAGENSDRISYVGDLVADIRGIPTTAGY